MADWIGKISRKHRQPAEGIFPDPLILSGSFFAAFAPVPTLPFSQQLGDAHVLEDPKRDRNRRWHGDQLLRLRRYLTRKRGSPAFIPAVPAPFPHHGDNVKIFVL